MPLDEGDVPELVSRLSADVTVDVSWEIRRLRDLAVEAQSRARYFGATGRDVQSYALRLAQLDADSEEAASLLRKVGERMSWDAEAARAEGEPERGADLLRQCLRLVPDHPRCLALSEAR